MLNVPRAQVVGIIGGNEQVANSLSPAIHDAAFAAAGLDWRYERFPVDTDVARAIDHLVASGVRGLNVTMPHKTRAIDAMDELSEAAEQIGAINTIQIHDGYKIGHNTDGPGLVGHIKGDLGVEITGRSVLVLGAGGGARAAVWSLARAGASSITVASRDNGASRSLASVAGEVPFESLALPVDQKRTASSQIIVNATPVGQKGEEPLISTQAIAPGAIVVDLVYWPPVTPLIELARRRGAIASSGLGMLLHQAALSFEIWTGVQPNLGAMSAAATSGLAGFKTSTPPAE
ncbi:MAG: shikimate dehydrogenase [Actinomycetota bacterium]|nr:shikimate dehydrogenase [Actinomycetota bacterium]